MDDSLLDTIIGTWFKISNFAIVFSNELPFNTSYHVISVRHTQHIYVW